jgi:hypothetical protein
MKKVQLSMAAIEDLKSKDYKSVLILGASNPAELKNADKIHLIASKELIFNERITQNSFHVNIDDPVLIEISKLMEVFIEIQ